MGRYLRCLATAVENGYGDECGAFGEMAFEKRKFDRVIAQIGRLGPSIRKSGRLYIRILDMRKDWKNVLHTGAPADIAFCWRGRMGLLVGP